MTIERVKEGSNSLIEPPEGYPEDLQRAPREPHGMVVEFECPHLPEAGTFANVNVDEARFVQKVVQPVASISEVIVRRVVDMPHERSCEEQTTARTQDAITLG